MAITSATGGITTNYLKNALVSSSYVDKAFFQLTGSVVGKFFLTASTTQTDAAPIYYVTTGSTATLTMVNIATKINTLTSAFKITASGSAATLQLTASAGIDSNNFSYTSASITQPFVNGYTSHTFLTSGQLQVTGSDTVALLVVGGGGGGSLGGGGESNDTNRGNGGGAGGFVSRSISLTAGVWTVIIGEGGKGGIINSSATSGEITSFTSASVSYTGSYGGFGGQPEGGNGSSGGGSYPTGGADIFSDSGSNGGTQQGKSGAGGGGAANSGSDAYFVFNDPFTIYNGGNGGTGLSNNLRNGTESFFAAGGGGGGWMNVGPGGGGTGGSSIGGNGGSGVQGAGAIGAANTGAGGGGGALSDQSINWGNGGDGGSGIVVVRYTV